MILKIEHDNNILAIIISSEYKNDGISFLTPPDFSQQLGYMNRKAGYEILPHVHNHINRNITNTQEVLIIKKGKVRVDFYTNDRVYLKSHIIKAGDIILLSSGGHGFKIIEDAEIFEVKQGPFLGEIDKTKFKPILEENLIYN
jgi:hypothetical protein